MRRAAERDGVSIEEVRKRDAMQLPAQQKVDAADFVIRNDGSLEELKKNATFIAALLKSLPPRHTIETEEEPEDPGEFDE
jgi:dephospho-CoA kinase